MPTQTTDPRAYAEAAIASLSTLATLDPSLSAVVTAAINGIRAKYPASAGPTDPPEAAPKSSAI